MLPEPVQAERHQVVHDVVLLATAVRARQHAGADVRGVRAADLRRRRESALSGCGSFQPRAGKTLDRIDSDNDYSRSVVTVSGLVTSVQRKITKAGATWAMVTVEDLEGAIEVLAPAGLEDKG